MTLTVLIDQERLIECEWCMALITTEDTAVDAAAREAAAVAEGPIFFAGGPDFAAGLAGRLLPTWFSCAVRDPTELPANPVISPQAN